MTQHVYVDILDDYLLPYTNDNLAQDWIFQADYDAEHIHNVNAKQRSTVVGSKPYWGIMEWREKQWREKTQI